MNATSRRAGSPAPRRSAVSHGVRRALRRCISGLAWSGVLLTSSVAPLWAATFPVTNTNDNGPGSLRDALAQAESTPGLDTIAMTGLAGTIVLSSGPLEITDSVAIRGPGRSLLTIDGSGDRLFSIDLTACGREVTVADVTLANSLVAINAFQAGDLDYFHCPDLGLQNSRLTVDRVTIQDSMRGVFAAARWAEMEVEIVDSLLTGNGDAIQTPDNSYIGAVTDLTIARTSIAGNTGSGVVHASGPLNMRDSEVTDNGDYGIASANAFGDSLNLVRSRVVRNRLGIDVWQSGFAIRDSIVSGNGSYGINARAGYAFTDVAIERSTIADNAGSGIQVHFYETANVAIDDSSLTGNGGGGISLQGIGRTAANLSVTNSTISGNHGLQGAGIFTTSDCAPGQMIVRNTTVTGNTVSGSGGGIYIGYSASGSYGCPSGLTLENTIVAGNSAEDAGPDLFGRFDVAFSLVGDSDAATLDETVPGSSLLGIDPLLGPLADNGGPTLTHLPLPGSPLIDAGDPGFTPPPDFDQRGDGFPRVVGGRIDIGAVEVGEAGPTASGAWITSLPAAGYAPPALAVLRHDAAAGQAYVSVRDSRDGLLLQRYELAGGAMPVTFAAVPDFADSTAVELAVLFADGRVALNDSFSGVPLPDVRFDPALAPVDLAAWAGATAPRLALLGRDTDPRVEVRRADTGSVTTRLDYRPTLDPVQLFVFPDLSGNTVPEIAMLGENRDPLGADLVQLKDPPTADKVAEIAIGGGFRVRASVVVDDTNGDGVAEIATLRTQPDLNQVYIADPVSGERLQRLNFDRSYAAFDVFSLPDYSGNGAPEIGVLTRDDAGNQKLQVKDAATNLPLLQLNLWPVFQAIDAVTLPDSDGNGAGEIAILTRRDADGQLRVYVFDAKSGKRLRVIDF